MELADLDAVLEIERQGFRSSWSRSDFADELEREWARIDVVRVQGGGRSKLVAFCNYWLVADEVQLLNVATHVEHRRQGYSRMLIDKMLSEASNDSCRLATLEVRRSNEAAIALYHSLGFTTVAVRANYYAAYGEDALVMHLHLEPER